MRRLATWLILLVSVSELSSLTAYAQNKAACELLTKADAEAVLGVTLLPPKPSEPFRSLLDPDHTAGTPDQGCEFTNMVPNGPRPPKPVNVRLEVRYASTPNSRAVDDTRKEVDTRTYDHPTSLQGLGDAAFWIGAPNNVTLFVFIGGTTRLMIGPSEIGLDQEKALAAKVLTKLGRTTFSYGTQPKGLSKPVPGSAPNPSALDQLKRTLTAKAEAGDVKAQVALATLYDSGKVSPDGTVQHDYAGAAYWFNEASNRGNAQAAYELAILYRDGLGVPADKAQSFALLQKASEANYVPAMPLLSDLYADQKTPASVQRATYWATKAAEAGESRGWLILGFEYSAGNLGGEPPYWYQSAMQAFRKAADSGNCVAMMAIGELYASGKGVPADRGAAESWSAKAESCESGNLAVLEQQIARYRAKTAAAREPVTRSFMDALPAIPKSAPPVANNGHNHDSRFLANLAVGASVLLAIAALLPDSPDTDVPVNNPFDNRQLLREFSCIDSGGRPSVAVGGCSH